EQDLKKNCYLKFDARCILCVKGWCPRSHSHHGELLPGPLPLIVERTPIMHERSEHSSRMF
ncbi:hypothetical protein AKJ16_DCAP18783, partial [Drosera capensis]